MLSTFMLKIKLINAAASTGTVDFYLCINVNSKFYQILEHDSFQFKWNS